MKSYPIWNVINSCAYANHNRGTGNKSYGIKEHGEVSCFIGTSAKNSHSFYSIETKHKILDDGTRIYKWLIDGNLAKKAVYKKGSDSPEIATYLEFKTN